MKDEMLLYGITLARRYTRRQKNAFYAMLKKDWLKDGHSVSLLGRQSRFFHHYHIIIGDLKKANTIIMTGYDTPAKSFISNDYYPFHSELNKKKAIRNLIIQTMLAILIMCLVFILFLNIKKLAMIWKVFCIITMIVLTYCSYRVSKGFANPVNFNQNSASLAVIQEIMNRSKSNKNVAFVLLDQTIDSFEGLKYMNQVIEENKRIIYLDAIANGEKLVIAHGKQMKHAAEELTSHFTNIDYINRCYDQERISQNALSFFPNMLYIASGEISNSEFVVHDIGSKKDNQVNMKRLSHICEGIMSYIMEEVSK